MEDDALLALVGARIKELRNQKKWTQLEFAELANSQDTYIGEIERGKRNISLRMLAKIANTLDVPVAELFKFGRIEEQESLSQKEQIVEIIKARLKTRSLEDVQLVQRIVDDLFQTIDSQYQNRQK